MRQHSRDLLTQQPGRGAAGLGHPIERPEQRGVAVPRALRALPLPGQAPVLARAARPHGVDPASALVVEGQILDSRQPGRQVQRASDGHRVGIEVHAGDVLKARAAQAQRSATTPGEEVDDPQGRAPVVEVVHAESTSCGALALRCQGDQSSRPPRMSRRQVRQVFDVLQGRARQLGWLPERVKLVWGAASDFPKDRDHAYATKNTITLAPKMADAPVQRVLGVLSHELAHAACIQNGEQHSEAEADAVGAKILGGRIGYDSDGVQSAGARGSRPTGLPK